MLLPQDQLCYLRFSFITQIWHFWHYCTKLASRCLKKFQQKNKVVSSGNWQLTITGLEVWCLFNCANLSCRAKSKKWSGAWNKIHFKESPIQHMSGWHSCISIRLQNQRWSVVSSTPTRGNFIFFLLKPFETPWCQFCTEMSDLCYLRKLQLTSAHPDPLHLSNSVQVDCGPLNCKRECDLCTIYWIVPHEQINKATSFLSIQLATG